MLRLQAARLKDLPIRGPAQEAVAQILELVEVRVADAKLALLATARADIDIEPKRLFQL